MSEKYINAKEGDEVFQGITPQKYFESHMMILEEVEGEADFNGLKRKCWIVKC